MPIPNPSLLPGPLLLPSLLEPDEEVVGGEIHSPQVRSFLSPSTSRLLDMLPPYEQESNDIQAALDALAMELDRLDARVAEGLATQFPQQALSYLKLWESELGIPIELPDKTQEQRQATVLAFVQSLNHSSTALHWQESLTRLIGTGWSYREHDPLDGSSPPWGTIRIGLPYSVALAAPTGLVGTPSTGGVLTAGTYYYMVTAINFYGETTVSTQASATVAPTGRVTLNWSDVSGATGYKVYRGTVSGGPKVLVASTVTSDYVDDGGQTPGPAPPTVNSTASFRAFEARALARQITPAHLALEFVFADAFVVGISQLGIDTL